MIRDWANIATVMATLMIMMHTTDTSMCDDSGDGDSNSDSMS